MMKNQFPYWADIHTIIFDFDGVFTDNRVLVSQDGLEAVNCSREDSLGIDILKRFIKKNNWELEFFILSTEKNNVVLSRSEKLKIKCNHGITDKLKFIKNYLNKRFPTKSNPQAGVIYLGNDLNDLKAMQFVGYSVSPKDAHHLIKKQATILLNKKGGNGFVRDLIEKLISCNNVDNDVLTDLI